jgi:hypothetical protein
MQDDGSHSQCDRSKLGFYIVCKCIVPIHLQEVRAMKLSCVKLDVAGGLEDTS